MVMDFAEWMLRIIWMKWTTLGGWNLASFARLSGSVDSWMKWQWWHQFASSRDQSWGGIDLMLQEDQSTTWRQVNFIVSPHHWGSNTCLSFLKYTYFKFKYACLTEDLVMVLSGKQPFLMLCYRKKYMLWTSVQCLTLFFLVLVIYFCITSLKLSCLKHLQIYFAYRFVICNFCWAQWRQLICVPFSTWCQLGQQ